MKLLFFYLICILLIQLIQGDFQIVSLPGTSTVNITQGSGQQSWTGIQQFLTG